MSQAGIINTAADPVPPSVPEEFVTDVNSPAIPAANVLNEVGGCKLVALFVFVYGL